MRIIEGSMLMIRFHQAPPCRRSCSAASIPATTPSRGSTSFMSCWSPALLLALITLHLMILWYQKRTVGPGRSRTDRNVIGYPFFPGLRGEVGGFFFVVFGVITLISATIQINPVWLWGRTTPQGSSAGTARLVRRFPRRRPSGDARVEINVFGQPLSLGAHTFGHPPRHHPDPLILYPWLEQWVPGDWREHHVLDRPRNQPVRTGIGVAFVTTSCCGSRAATTSWPPSSTSRSTGSPGSCASP